MSLPAGAASSSRRAASALTAAASPPSSLPHLPGVKILESDLKLGRKLGSGGFGGKTANELKAETRETRTSMVMGQPQQQLLLNCLRRNSVNAVRCCCGVIPHCVSDVFL